MKTVAAALLLSLLASNAQAIERYMSTSMTCAAVKAAINQQGAVILQHRSKRTGVLLYDRYVKNRLFCPGGQTTDRAYIPTSDLSACPVNRCEDIQFFDYR